MQPPPGKMPARWLECGGLDAEFRRGVAGRQHQQAVWAEAGFVHAACASNQGIGLRMGLSPTPTPTPTQPSEPHVRGPSNRRFPGIRKTPVVFL